MTFTRASLLLGPLLMGGCLDTLSVGLSSSAVLDAGDDDDVELDAGDVDSALVDAMVDDADAKSADAGDAGDEVDAGSLELCPIAYCAAAGITANGTTPRCDDGGVAMCVREDPARCGWTCSP